MDFQGELDALYKKALELKAQGRQSDSDLLELKAAEILQDLKNQAEQHSDDPATIAILLYLADKEWAIVGDHERVLSRIEKALDLAEKKVGAKDVRTAHAAAKLAEFHFLAGRFGEAEPLYRRAVSIYAGTKADGDSMQAKAFEGLAQTLAVLGRVEEADAFFARAIDLAGTGESEKRPLYFLLMTRADGLEKLGRHAEAEEHRQKAAGLLPKNNPGELGFHA